MIEQVHVYPCILAAGGQRYVASAWSDSLPGGRWEAWLVYFPLKPGPPVVGDRETSQDGQGAVGRWAHGVSAVYLQGALRRALRAGGAPLWRHNARKHEPGYARDEMQLYQRDARRLRALGRRLLDEGAFSPDPVPLPEVVVQAADAPARAPRSRSKAGRVPAPRQIKQWLDRYVVGQERAKKVLSVAVANHYKRLHWKRRHGSEIGLQKSNVLLLGPTGSGKTLLVETLARVLEVPLVTADATRFTEAGYTGADVDEIVADLLTAASGDAELAESGIVTIDEIDKLARRETTGRDVSGEGVQQALLKLLEGTRVNLPIEGGLLRTADSMAVDTTDVLFICAGAFAGIEEILGAGKGRRIGFGAPELPPGPEVLWEVTPRELVQFGMIPELVGRLPVMVALDGLDEAMLVDILTRPEDALVKQYQRLFSMDRVELAFTKDALHAVARKAWALGTGARGLRTVMESVMLELMYEMPRSSRPRVVKVTEDVVELRAAPVVRYRKRPGR